MYTFITLNASHATKCMLFLFHSYSDILICLLYMMLYTPCSYSNISFSTSLFYMKLHILYFNHTQIQCIFICLLKIIFYTFHSYSDISKCLLCMLQHTFCSYSDIYMIYCTLSPFYSTQIQSNFGRSNSPVSNTMDGWNSCTYFRL